MISETPASADKSKLIDWTNITPEAEAILIEMQASGVLVSLEISKLPRHTVGAQPILYNITAVIPPQSKAIHECQICLHAKDLEAGVRLLETTVGAFISTHRLLSD